MNPIGTPTTGGDTSGAAAAVDFEPGEIQTRKGRCRVDLNSCYIQVKLCLFGTFSRFGRLVGRYPLPFVILPILVFGGLGAGLTQMESETGVEEVYFPLDSRAKGEREIVRKRFTDKRRFYYNKFSLEREDNAISFIFLSVSGGNILSDESSSEIRKTLMLFSGVRDHVCARKDGECVVDGNYLLSPTFRGALKAGYVTYPKWDVAGRNIDLGDQLSAVATDGDGKLVSAGVLKVTMKLAYSVEYFKAVLIRDTESIKLTHSRMLFEMPGQLSDELTESTKGDISIFGGTIALCCLYAVVVTTGGNPVSTRSWLALAGILSAGLGIIGAMGLLSACGVKFVDIVGVVPFLIIGIALDNIFLVMSAWSGLLGETDLSVPNRVGTTVGMAGIGMTITSLTDFLAFMIGSSSNFLSVINFSLNAGFSIMFSYLANLTFFTACLTYHGRRVYSERHCCTCRKTRPREELLAGGRSKCMAMLCGGSVPSNSGEDESMLEMLPRKCLPKLFAKKGVCIFIVVLFASYLAVAIYGAANLEVGLMLKDLVPKSSQLHEYLTVNYEHFPESLPVSFVVNGEVDYLGREGDQLLDLLSEATKDVQIIPNSQRCWLSAFRNSSSYDPAEPANFTTNVYDFVNTETDFIADVVFGSDSNKATILLSRCFVLSTKNSDQHALAKLMERMRKVADASSLPVFAFHPSFFTFEQFLAVLPATLKMVGCAVAAITVVTFAMLPHLLMVALVVVTIVMILVGIFGFMYFWGITLSSITMIHLVMSVGFSVDFSAHVCAAYLVSSRSTRLARAEDAIRHAASPILNGALSTMVGVLLLVISKSYVFITFFKIIFILLLLGVLHSVLFLPAVLALVGPQHV